MRFPFDGTYRISQNFGENPASYARFGLKGHNGIDFATPTGTLIIATHSGIVKEVTNDATGYGLYIKIENSFEGSLYAHLKEFKVKVGDTVTEGQVIGISDNTGNSTGPHLHFGYYRLPRDRQNGYAGYIDPAPFLNQPAPAPVPVSAEYDRDINWNLILFVCGLLNVEANGNDKEATKKRIGEAITELQVKAGQVITLEAQVSNHAKDQETAVNQAKLELENQFKIDKEAWATEREGLNRSISQCQRRLNEKIPTTFVGRLKFLFG